jgi:hypothetical protein
VRWGARRPDRRRRESQWSPDRSATHWQLHLRRRAWPASRPGADTISGLTADFKITGPDTRRIFRPRVSLSTSLATVLRASATACADPGEHPPRHAGYLGRGARCSPGAHMRTRTGRKSAAAPAAKQPRDRGSRSQHDGGLSIALGDRLVEFPETLLRPRDELVDVWTFRFREAPNDVLVDLS